MKSLGVTFRLITSPLGAEVSFTPVISKEQIENNASCIRLIFYHHGGCCT